MKRLYILLFVGLFAVLFSCSKVAPIDASKVSHIQDAYDLLVDEIDFTSVSSDFTLPVRIYEDEEEVLVSAVSRNTSILDINGTEVIITRQTTNTNVVVDITLSYQEVEINYPTVVTIIGLSGVDADFVNSWEEVEAALNASAPDKNAVSSNLNLLTATSYDGVSIYWSSSRPRTIAPNGTVTLAFGTQSVTLTAFMSKNGNYQSRSYSFKVSASSYTVTEFTPYEYYNGGGEGVYANPLMTLDEQVEAFNTSYQRVMIPSHGENKSNISVNVVVLPIEFTNDTFTQAELTKIEKGFFGTEEDTGWESLQTYYQKSSFGKVDINGVVLPPFNVGTTHGLFATEYSNRVDYASIALSVEHVQNNIDPAQFDANGDGYIDAIYLVYSRSHSSGDWGGVYWAHKSMYMAGYDSFPDVVYTSGTNEYRPSGFMWASHDFLDESIGVNVSINAETFIHESGHLFGLPDYYDYDATVGPSGGLGGADMMDWNCGDHGPWNKIILGWIVPQVVTESITVKLYRATATGQALIIPYNWNHNLFSEYLVVDFFTPDGLYDYGTGYMMNKAGVRVYHVDATLGSPFLFNNSYTAHKLIDWVSAQARSTTSTQFTAGNQELWQVTGNQYDWDSFSWYTLGIVNPRVSITVQEITATYAVVSVSYIQY